MHKKRLRTPTLLSYLNEKNRKLVAIGNILTRSQADDDCICFCVAYAHRIHRFVNDDGALCFMFVTASSKRGGKAENVICNYGISRLKRNVCVVN